MYISIGNDFNVDKEAAIGCFKHLNNIFNELKDYRAFELLRTATQRGDYLLTKQARIVALTCTHAAMTRRRLVELRIYALFFSLSYITI